MSARSKLAVAALSFAISGAHAAPPAAPEIPAEVLAVFARHVGAWKTEGTLMTNGTSQPARASWDCQRAAGGVGVVCSWTHEWPDGRQDKAIELIGYDAARATLTYARLTDQGVIRLVTPEIRGDTLYYRWETARDGKPLVGVNEVVMRKVGDWTQRMTIDVDGKRETEMRLTHHRVE